MSSSFLDQHPPIFVVGTGRSGSTVFFDVFATHRDVVWPSRLSRDYPDYPWVNDLWMRFRTSALLSPFLDRRFAPSEAYPFWDRLFPGFSNPYRDLGEHDVTPPAADRIRDEIAGLAERHKKTFVAKITGWPRVRFLNAVFSHSRFIEITRDPRATVSSLLQVPFWDGWRGPPNWRRGPLPEDLRELWKSENESFVALAAIEYLIVRRAMDTCRQAVPPDRFLTVAYESLCLDPVGTFKDVASFCHLTWTKQFERSIGRFQLVNRDYKWQQDLTSDQQATLIRTLEAGSVQYPGPGS